MNNEYENESNPVLQYRNKNRISQSQLMQLNDSRNSSTATEQNPINPTIPQNFSDSTKSLPLSSSIPIKKTNSITNSLANPTNSNRFTIKNPLSNNNINNSAQEKEPDLRTRFTKLKKLKEDLELNDKKDQKVTKGDKYKDEDDEDNKNSGHNIISFPKENRNSGNGKPMSFMQKLIESKNRKWIKQDKMDIIKGNKEDIIMEQEHEESNKPSLINTPCKNFEEGNDNLKVNRYSSKEQINIIRDNGEEERNNNNSDQENKEESNKKEEIKNKLLKLALVKQKFNQIKKDEEDDNEMEDKEEEDEEKEETEKDVSEDNDGDNIGNEGNIQKDLNIKSNDKSNTYSNNESKDSNDNINEEEDDQINLLDSNTQPFISKVEDNKNLNKEEPNNIGNQVDPEINNEIEEQEENDENCLKKDDLPVISAYPKDIKADELDFSDDNDIIEVNNLKNNNNESSKNLNASYKNQENKIKNEDHENNNVVANKGNIKLNNQILYDDNENDDENNNYLLEDDVVNQSRDKKSNQIIISNIVNFDCEEVNNYKNNDLNENNKELEKSLNEQVEQEINDKVNKIEEPIVDSEKIKIKEQDSNNNSKNIDYTNEQKDNILINSNLKESTNIKESQDLKEEDTQFEEIDINNPYPDNPQSNQNPIINTANSSDTKENEIQIRCINNNVVPKTKPIVQSKSNLKPKPPTINNPSNNPKSSTSTSSKKSPEEDKALKLNKLNQIREQREQNIKKRREDKQKQNKENLAEFNRQLEDKKKKEEQDKIEKERVENLQKEIEKEKLRQKMLEDQKIEQENKKKEQDKKMERKLREKMREQREALLAEKIKKQEEDQKLMVEMAMNRKDNPQLYQKQLKEFKMRKMKQENNEDNNEDVLDSGAINYENNNYLSYYDNSNNTNFNNCNNIFDNVNSNICGKGEFNNNYGYKEDINEEKSYGESGKIMNNNYNNINKVNNFNNAINNVNIVYRKGGGKINNMPNCSSNSNQGQKLYSKKKINTNIPNQNNIYNNMNINNKNYGDNNNNMFNNMQNFNLNSNNQYMCNPYLYDNQFNNNQIIDDYNFNSNNCMNNYTQNNNNYITNNSTNNNFMLNKNRSFDYNVSSSPFNDNSIQNMSQSPSNNTYNYNQINSSFYNNPSNISNFNNNQFSPNNPYNKTNKKVQINLEDIAIIEEKLKEIINGIEIEKNVKNECFEWWNYYFNSDLLGSFESAFKDENHKNVVSIFIKYELFSVLLAYDITKINHIYMKISFMLKEIFTLIKNNFITLCEYIISKVANEHANNAWVYKIQCIVNNHKTNQNNISDMNNYNNSFSLNTYQYVEIISKNTNYIINDLKIVLNNYIDTNKNNSNKSKLSSLLNLFSNITQYDYPKINDFFQEEIFEIDNINSSLVGAQILRDTLPTLSTNPNNNQSNNSTSNSINNPQQVEPPFIKTTNFKEYTLILGLNETIVHLIKNPNDPHEGILKVRPGIYNFLEKLSNYYEIIIFTISSKEFADELIDALEENKLYFDYKLYRQHCSIVDGEYIKDLSKIGRPIDRMIIVDNKPQNFRFQKENGIIIKSFYGNDYNDQALYDLMPILENIAKSGEDTRLGLMKFRDEILRKVTSNVSKMIF